jgi:hypothetical protein
MDGGGFDWGPARRAFDEAIEDLPYGGRPSPPWPPPEATGGGGNFCLPCAGYDTPRKRRCSACPFFNEWSRDRTSAAPPQRRRFLQRLFRKQPQ